MRIGTWNVEYANHSKNPHRLELLTAHPADIWVLTETHDDLELPEPYCKVSSEQRPFFSKGKVKSGSRWVTIWSRFPLVQKISVPDPFRMVAAILDAPKGHLVIAGIVLPWSGDKSDHPSDKSPKGWENHKRVLKDELPILLKSVRENSPGSRRVIAGDFNSHQAFPYRLKSAFPNESLRRELASLLANDSLRCHTSEVQYPHPLPPRCIDQTLIDHICTDFGTVDGPIVTWSGEVGKLSDHPGVVVSLKE